MAVEAAADGGHARRRSRGGDPSATRPRRSRRRRRSTTTPTSATCSSAPARAKPPRASRSAPSRASCSSSSASRSSATSSSIGSASIGDPLAVTFEQVQRHSARLAELHCVDADVEQQMMRGDRRGAGGRRHRRRQLRSDRARPADRARQPRAMGPQARWPARAGADVDSGDQGGRHRPRTRASPTCPARRIHDEILPLPRRDGASGDRRCPRPTNNAGGLEGGITNGEDLRVTGYMKPIATLMKPLRSVDLDHARAEPRGHRAQRRLRRARRGRRRRSHGRDRPRRRGAREIRRRLDRTKCWTTSSSYRARTAARFAHD